MRFQSASDHYQWGDRAVTGHWAGGLIASRETVT